MAWHGARRTEELFLLWAATGELSHKPALACAVSASDGGAYVIAELRMSSYKNNRLCWIPEHLITRHVKTLGNEDDALNDASTHEAFEKALYALQLLVAYADALGPVRPLGSSTTRRS